MNDPTVTLAAEIGFSEFLHQLSFCLTFCFWMLMYVL